jgi:DNA-binding Lrp family transcriptional regulator
MKICNMPIAYVLLNSDLGSDSSIIEEIKPILQEEDIQFEIQGVYGVYDIVLKLSSDDAENLRSIITNKIRKISKVQSTLTMMVIEEQENL